MQDSCLNLASAGIDEPRGVAGNGDKSRSVGLSRASSIDRLPYRVRPVPKLGRLGPTTGGESVARLDPEIERTDRSHRSEDRNGHAGAKTLAVGGRSNRHSI